MKSRGGDSDSLMSLLSGHPSVIEVVRIAGRLTNAEAEVIVFDDARASVVGSIGSNLLQPRSYTPTESAIMNGAAGHQADGQSVSFPISDRHGDPAGALTVFGPIGTTEPDIFHGLARMCASVAHQSASDGTLEAHVLESLRDAVIVMDHEWIIRYANQAVAIQMGRSPVELIGTSAIDLLHPGDVNAAAEAMVGLSNRDLVYRFVGRVLNGAGEYVRLEVTGRDMTNDPQVGGMVLSLRNGDHDLELESTLERAERVSKAMVEQLHDGIIATDAVGSIIVVNSAARQIFGLSSSVPLAGLKPEDIAFRDAESRLLEGKRHPIRRLLAGSIITKEDVVVVADGEYRNLELSGRPVIGIDDKTIGTSIGVHDVTAARRAEREMRTRALHDQLTGLANRRQLDDHLGRLRRQHRRSDDAATLIAGCLIDLDNFKVINDTHGHRAGDAVIRGVADLISQGRKPEDLVVRLGGDEFVVVFETTSTEEALRVANAIRRRLTRPVRTVDHEFVLTASIGLTIQSPTELEEDSLLRAADVALYSAKAKGRNRVEIFDEELAREVGIAEDQRRMLRRALDEDGLVMHFQPLVSADDNKLIGFESLARCRAADGTLVGPEGFVDAASGSGLVWELDRQAFELTCQAAAVFNTLAPGLTVACNFSGLSILQTGFAEELGEVMKKHRVDPTSICVEITESAAFEAGPPALAALDQISALGIRLALDDFGTGYSSLAHLRDLPLSIVKVDRSFIANLTNGSSDHSIAKAIVALAAELDLGVVAEGVETMQQLETAKGLGFNVIQGWHYSPAKSLEQIVDLLTDQAGAARFTLPASWRQVETNASF